jgi:hypothetical protein
VSEAAHVGTKETYTSVKRDLLTSVVINVSEAAHVGTKETYTSVKRDLLTRVVINVSEAAHVGTCHHMPQVFHRVRNRRVKRHLVQKYNNLVHHSNSIARFNNRL